MAKFEERSKLWNIFYSPLVMILLLVVFLLMFRALWRVYNYERISSLERNRVERELSETSQKSATLKKQVDNLQTERGIDDEIRAKFNVVKKGENVAVILNSTNTIDATSSAVIEESWWEKFTNVFH